MSKAMPHPNPRILCVEENEDICELIDVILHKSNAHYQIESAKTADECLALAATGNFDLYVLDYRYASMSGIEVCRRIRLTDARTPILFFSTEARDVSRQKALAAGANAYLIKPNDIDKLSETVQRLLGEHSFRATT